MTKVLVTGATGNTGREVVAALLRDGVTVRAAMRSPESSRLSQGIETTTLDFHDPGTFASAAQGCSSVFLLRPPPISDVQATLNRFIDAAREVGVDHVVFLSVMGATGSRVVPHAKVEEHLVARSSATSRYTILQPGFFAQNLQDAYRRDIVEDGRLYVPVADARAAFIDLRDVAEVASLVFRHPDEHHEKTHALTGPEPVSFDAVAKMLSAALDRTIRYEPASVIGYLRHLRARQCPWAQSAVQLLIHLSVRYGHAATVKPDLHELLGHPGRTVQEYIRDHTRVWR